MSSTFFGLETARRALATQQSALYTTGHNIANANTLGYSRQSVNFTATTPFPSVGLNSPKIPGQMGTGVEAGSVTRIRDAFIDSQYRDESNKLGYWESRSQAISQMEDFLNEPSEYGLSKSMDQFWSSLQDLSVNPENDGARAVVVQRAVAVADSFNYIHESLSKIQDNLGNEMSISLQSVNSILSQIAELNQQISTVEPNGYLPNDLYDKRDLLLDELSQYIKFDVQYTKSGGNTLPIADGIATISISDGNGGKIQLVSGNKNLEFRVSPSNATASTMNEKLKPTGPITGFTFVQVDENGNESGPNPPTPTIAPEKMANGKIRAIMHSFGYGDNKGVYPEMISEIDKLAKAYAEAFNAQHGDPEFFSEITSAGTIKVNQAIIDNPSLIAATSVPGEEGNGKNALALADVKFKELADLGGASFQTYFEGVIGQMGVNGQEAQRMAFNSATLQLAVEERKASVSSVSLDEEMTNMIRFQHAYNAAARSLTAVDEILDKVINGMGRVGL
ncbi:flagellar hook-associated protein FlgK [Robertmurraya massiliosenegalensis]|uniref:flagellar hook-associated protein FlgK n=1 Tax=Robertmurraya massiliosenegalensis TaxID=1287657 RepID=UPI000305ED43|nr:flagellar hook-associated protein FlgK [Robertmurraya massiliosenegalensis]